MALSFEDIKVGSVVRIKQYAGMRINREPEYKEANGKVVMRGAEGWVINMGGRYGTPEICTEENFVKVVRRG